MTNRTTAEALVTETTDAPALPAHVRRHEPSR